MPLVIVRYDLKFSPEAQGDGQAAEERRRGISVIRELSDRLPVLVAQALHTPENPSGRLKPDDIAVSFQPTGVFDVNTVEFSILVLANDYPERRKDLESRKNLILGGVSALIPEPWKFSVWVRLAVGAYGASP